MIRVFGDSITSGVPGAAYCDCLKGRITFKQYGLGGDTVTGLIRRLCRVAMAAEDMVIVEIGTNDILLPYLKSTSKNWQRLVSSIERSGRIPVGSMEEFSEKYRILAEILSEHRVVFVSIPCIGEDIESEVNAKVDSYNAVIKEICTEQKGWYVDFNQAQKNEIRRGLRRSNSYVVGEDSTTMMFDVVATKVLGLTEYLSRKRELITTIDGVHLNQRGATLLANMIMAGFQNL
jgi:lysophospholipase L1-like esterase